MNQPELRYCELRASDDGRTLEGRAILYSDVATLPWGEERVMAGAFSPLGEVKMNVMHERSRILCRTGGGLRLEDTPEALRIEAKLPDTMAARDVVEMVRSKVYRGLSIEFHAVSERMENSVRIIEKGELVGVAVVDDGAYSKSYVEARQKALERPTERPRRRVWL